MITKHRDVRSSRSNPDRTQTDSRSTPDRAQTAPGIHDVTTSSSPLETSPPAAPAAGIDVAALQSVLQKLAEGIRDERTHAEMLFRQSETLTSLLAFLRPDAPFPPTRGWAASPDFLMLEVEAILDLARRDGLTDLHVVEASSGLSTLTAAYTLKRLGADPQTARVTSHEHDAGYAAKTNALLDRHDLTAFATVVHAPLVPHEIEGTTFQWYDPSTLDDLAPISLLVVDGPPGRLGPIARYPALPCFHSHLRPGAIVLADDADRPGETEMIRRWCAEHPEARYDAPDTEKGAARLRFP